MTVPPGGGEPSASAGATVADDPSGGTPPSSSLVIARHRHLKWRALDPLEHLLETSIETFENTLALTCTAVFHLTQLALPLLRRATPSARIINIGDANCDRIEAHDDATPYHIAKLGVHVLTRTYAQQLGGDRITVNMVSPGFLENSVGEPDQPIPLGRKGRFSDITGAIDFLVSDAAAYVTGTNLRVSGGFNL